MNKWLFFRLSDVIFVLTFLISWVGFSSILASFDLIQSDPITELSFAIFLAFWFGILAAVFHRIMFIIFRKNSSKRTISLNALFVPRKKMLSILLQTIFTSVLLGLIYVAYRSIIGEFGFHFYVIFYPLVIICSYIFLNFIAVIKYDKELQKQFC